MYSPLKKNNQKIYWTRPIRVTAFDYVEVYAIEGYIIDKNEKPIIGYIISYNLNCEERYSLEEVVLTDTLEREEHQELLTLDQAKNLGLAIFRTKNIVKYKNDKLLK